MFLLLKRTHTITASDLERAGYKRINQWKYIFNVKKGVRWHAKVIGKYIEIHQDKTIYGWHRVCLSNIGKEIGRIKQTRNNYASNSRKT